MRSGWCEGSAALLDDSEGETAALLDLRHQLTQLKRLASPILSEGVVHD